MWSPHSYECNKCIFNRTELKTRCTHTHTHELRHNTLAHRRFVNCGVLLKQKGKQGSLLLLGHTDSATTTAGGLGVLTTHTQTGRRKKREKGGVNQQDRFQTETLKKKSNSSTSSHHKTIWRSWVYTNKSNS